MWDYGYRSLVWWTTRMREVNIHADWVQEMLCGGCRLKK